MKLKTILLLVIIAITYSAQAKYPLFTQCQTKADSLIQDCSRATFESYIKMGQSKIGKSMGVYMLGEVNVVFKVKSNGSISVKSANSPISDQLEEKCIEWINGLEGQVIPNGDDDTFEVTFDLSLPALNISDISETANCPTLVNCTEFNALGQRSCLNYLFNEMITDLYLRGYEGFARFDVIFSPVGKLMAVDFTVPARNKRINDSLVGRFLNLDPYLAISNDAKQNYFNQFYKLTYAYEYFTSDLSKRTFLTRKAEDLMARHDTDDAVEMLFKAASTFRKYQDLVKYFEMEGEKYGLEGHESINTCMGKLSIDTLIKKNIHFDVKTDTVLMVMGKKAIPEECEKEPGNLDRCISEYLMDYLDEELKNRMDLSIFDDSFSHSFQNRLYPSEAIIHVDVNADGSFNRIVPDLFPDEIYYRNMALRPAYVLDEGQRHFYSIMFIDILSNLREFSQPELGGFGCRDQRFYPIIIGTLSE